jgi:Na+/H+-dicarboxylate symporter
VIVGALFPQVALSLRFLGEIFMAALKMLIMPLILVTMIVGVSSLKSPGELGRLGSRAIIYYLSTTMLAIMIGLVAVNLMRPGETPLPSALRTTIEEAHHKLENDTKTQSEQVKPAIERAFYQHIAQDIPSNEAELLARAKNLSQVASQQITHTLTQQQPSLRLKLALGNARAELIFARIGMRRSLEAAEEMREQSQQKGPPLTVARFLYMQISKILQNPFESMATGNVLGIIVFSIMLGLILVSMGDRGQPVLQIADSLNQAMMKLVSVVMKFTPYGVFSLIAFQIAQSGFDILILLGKYMLCVLIALAIHGVIVLPTILLIIARRSPLVLFKQVRDALGVAFSTSSSSATLPVSLEVTEKQANVSPRVAGFVLPLGATINMDGTALYEAIAAMFIAQIYGIELGIGPQILIFLTAALAAIGAAGIPSAGTVTMVMVLSAVGLPIAGIGLILAVDRILDMCRTTINVWGDIIGAAIIQQLESPNNTKTA